MFRCLKFVHRQYLNGLKFSSIFCWVWQEFLDGSKLVQKGRQVCACVSGLENSRQHCLVWWEFLDESKLVQKRIGEIRKTLSKLL